jgi:hypothetical protein
MKWPILTIKFVNLQARENGFVFMIIESEFYGHDIDPCGYSMLPKRFFTFPAGFAVKRGSPLAALFNRA